MISYKRDVLERQSLSEVKMGRGSPICERVRINIVEYFKNNVPQCQVAKALQISSTTSTSKYLEKLAKSLCIRDKAEDLCWMHVVFGPSNDTASLIGMVLSLTLLNGPGILPETTVSKHNPSCHLQMPTKALSYKKEAICEHGPEALLCPVGQGSFKMDCFKVEKCSMVRRAKFDILVGNHGSVSSGLKMRETFQHFISVQFKTQYL